MATLEEAAKKEIVKMRKMMQSLKVVEERKEEEQVKELKKLVDSYWTDAQHFLERKQFLEAFEAAVICWAYVDAGLHLGIFRIDSSLANLFTI